MKLKVEEPDRVQARKGASLLERASVREHGGLYLTKADGDGRNAGLRAARDAEPTDGCGRVQHGIRFQAGGLCRRAGPVRDHRARNVAWDP
jgi:hypothetical protein